MDLNTLWFILVAVLFIGFFILEGFDYGVGILLNLVAKTDRERRVVINSIGPIWDGNEVWMLTAGGAIFAAFPQWYATMFSGYYLALVLLLLAIITRAVSFEFRSKQDSTKWRRNWDILIGVSSFLPALLWGVAMTNLLLGLPIDETMTYTGGFFTLLSPLALVGGLASLCVFTLHGALYLSLKTEGDIQSRARKVASRLSPVALLLVLVLGIGVIAVTGAFFEKTPLVFAGPIIALAGAILAVMFVRKKRDGKAFAFTSLTIAATVISLFSALFPNVMISSTDVAYNLTVYNASSSAYTLKIMSIVALIFVPFVLGYQGWTLWVFRKRIRVDDHLEY